MSSIPIFESFLHFDHRPFHFSTKKTFLFFFCLAPSVKDGFNDIRVTVIKFQRIAKQGRFPFLRAQTYETLLAGFF